MDLTWAASGIAGNMSGCSRKGKVMKFVEAKCPKCGGELHVPEDVESIICMYCGDKLTALELGLVQEESRQQDPERSGLLFGEALAMFNGDMSNPIGHSKRFTRAEYPFSFTLYYDQFVPVLQTFDKAYRNDPSDELVDQFGRALTQVVIGKAGYQNGKIKKLEDEMDCINLIVAFMVPAVLKYSRTYADQMANSILDGWNDRFPKTKIGKASYEELNEGFKRKWCFITTAVCESLGRPDDCAELNALRSFRDGWLASQEDGRAMIEEYYLLAPILVRKMDGSADRKAVYGHLWNDYLRPCLDQLEQGNLQACRDGYRSMVDELRGRYF